MEINKTKVTLNFYKSSGKWYDDYTYESDYSVWEGENLNNEAKAKGPKMDFTIKAESAGGEMYQAFVKNDSPETTNSTPSTDKLIEDMDQILERAILEYGVEKQIDMWFEESSELTQVLCKIKRLHGITRAIKKGHYIYKPTQSSDSDYTLAYHNLCGEVADVEIILRQIRKMLDNETIDLIKVRKITRLEARLDKGEF